MCAQYLCTCITLVHVGIFYNKQLVYVLLGLLSVWYYHIRKIH